MASRLLQTSGPRPAVLGNISISIVGTSSKRLPDARRVEMDKPVHNLESMGGYVIACPAENQSAPSTTIPMSFWNLVLGRARWPGPY